MKTHRGAIESRREGVPQQGLPKQGLSRNVPQVIADTIASDWHFGQRFIGCNEPEINSLQEDTTRDTELSG
ncbi:protein of heat shock protein Hsp70 family [Anopheles sinensis]|uniref:Protein of heat shock protein Hsp70 family n=1 Tax=Anopheles sinensis TaxID=74873 RepID=A0A084WGP7_ANOSI|nr:protein of heat shock protein Hsp70 family [Anopheles sinensis]